MLRTLLLLCAALLLPTTSHAAKHAFVVGINAYDNLGQNVQLQKARPDAEAIAKAFTDLQFDVTLKLDVTRSQFLDVWSGFLGKVAAGDIVAVYFAGHGVEIAGRNYLVPRNIPSIKPGRDEQLKRESIAVHELQSDLKDRRTRFSLLIIDACRENPFEKLGTRTTGSERGLAPAEPPAGSFIMYSAGSGETALDRLQDSEADANSVYTRRLLPLLKSPGLTLTTMAERVRTEVRALAETVNHIQTPAFYSQTLGPACLSGDICGDVAPVTASLDKQRQAAHEWETLRGSKDTQKLLKFIDAFRDTPPAELAHKRIAELTLERASGDGTEKPKGILDRIASAITGGGAKDGKPSAPKSNPALPQPTPPPAPVRPKMPDVPDDELADWRAAHVINTAASYESFIKKWPTSRFVDNARKERDRQRQTTYSLAGVEQATRDVAVAIRTKKLNRDRFKVVVGKYRYLGVSACNSPQPRTLSILRGMGISFMYYNGLLSAIRYRDPTRFQVGNVDSDVPPPTANPRLLVVELDPAAVIRIVATARSSDFPLADEAEHIKELAKELLTYKRHFDEKISPRVMRLIDLQQMSYDTLGFSKPDDPCMAHSVALTNVGPANETCLKCSHDYEGYIVESAHDFLYDFWYRRNREGTAAIAEIVLQYIVEH